MKLEFRNIELSDKPLFDNLFTYYSSGAQESSFAYIYLWQHNFDLKMASGDGWIVVRIDMGDDYSYKLIYQPDRLYMVLDLMEQYAHSLGQKVQLAFLEEQERNMILELRPLWHASKQELYFDYVYSLTEVNAMNGSRYSSMRKQVSRFLRDCPNYSFGLMQETDYDECIHLLEEWCQKKREQGKEYSTIEVDLNRKAIQLRKELDLVVFVLRVDCKLVGYFIDYASPTSKTVVGLIGKALLISPGIVKMMEHLASGYWMNKYTYVNNGDDSGCEGLRATKEAMNPVKKIYKHTLTED